MMAAKLLKPVDWAKIWVPVCGVLIVAVTGCSPTVKVEAPSEPITINLNVKLDADVRLRLIEEAGDDVDSNPIF